MTLYRLLGLLIALYTLRAVRRGEVYARSGFGGRRISRDDSPTDFWTVIVIYALLALAVATLF